jgi:hypothetical protein
MIGRSSRALGHQLATTTHYIQHSPHGPPHALCLGSMVHCILRATLHTRLRARDHHTSSTLDGGKGGAGLSLLHTTFEGPTEYVNARWM